MPALTLPQLISALQRLTDLEPVSVIADDLRVSPRELDEQVRPYGFPDWAEVDASLKRLLREQEAREPMTERQAQQQLSAAGPAPVDPTATSERLARIPLYLLEPDPNNPRADATDDVEDLMASIKANGLLQPIVARLMRIHVTEEARHISFARDGLRRRAKVQDWREKHVLSNAHGATALLFNRWLTNPAMYERVGLDGGECAALARSNPHFATLNINVSYTRCFSATTPDAVTKMLARLPAGLTVTPGRPKLQSTLATVVDRATMLFHGGRENRGAPAGVLVTVCGPQGLAEDVRKAVRGIEPARRRRAGGRAGRRGTGARAGAGTGARASARAVR